MKASKKQMMKHAMQCCFENLVGIALSAAHIAIQFACAILQLLLHTGSLAAMLTTSATAITKSCPTEITTAAAVPTVLDTIFAVTACDSSTPDTHICCWP